MTSLTPRSSEQKRMTKKEIEIKLREVMSAYEVLAREYIILRNIMEKSGMVKFE